MYYDDMIKELVDECFKELSANDSFVFTGHNFNAQGVEKIKKSWVEILDFGIRFKLGFDKATVRNKRLLHKKMKRNYSIIYDILVLGKSFKTIATENEISYKRTRDIVHRDCKKINYEVYRRDPYNLHRITSKDNPLKTKEDIQRWFDNHEGHWNPTLGYLRENKWEFINPLYGELVYWGLVDDSIKAPPIK